MSNKNHVHKFKRLRYKSGNLIYFCALPDCQHKIATPLALGKRSICWRCGEEFVMNEYSIRLAKPHCDNCHKPKSNNSEPEIDITFIPPSVAIFENIEQAVNAIEHEDKSKQDSVNELRQKLNSVHSNLIAKPDDEDI